MSQSTFRTWRGDSAGGGLQDYLCQDVCHALREHRLFDSFAGPRFLVHIAALEMHPLDTEDRTEELRKAHGIGYCNITKCCTKVCPESITITDNAIIPLKERVADAFYDPVTWLWRKVTGRGRKASAHPGAQSGAG